MTKAKEMLEPPFEIYLNGVEIADKNGHVCTAESPRIAKQILAALSVPPGDRAREAVIDQCAKIADEEADFWIRGEATTAVGQAYQNAARNIAKHIRALSSPVENKGS